ncbi:flagellar protein FliS [Nocardioides panacis]|uniref:Flagellar protein FliS n=1 Tax=Nocardioides panacis TaxID=2849501 RepID=A0A975Y0H8_9ACTN|nr:flagellar export chaperone FliS [Nocardioides panacis]QWZ08483.1 flagellar protein FliS [Nocardioides panacis]
MTTTARDTYLGGMTSTASPARLLIMLYDRLVLDLQRAIELGDAGEFLGAGRQLMHAQEIVLELQGSLRIDAWDGAAGLSGIYSWLHSEMVRANVQRDVAATRACLALVEPLADAWREAALAALV